MRRDLIAATWRLGFRRRTWSVPRASTRRSSGWSRSRSGRAGSATGVEAASSLGRNRRTGRVVRDSEGNLLVIGQRLDWSKRPRAAHRGSGRVQVAGARIAGRWTSGIRLGRCSSPWLEQGNCGFGRRGAPSLRHWFARPARGARHLPPAEVGSDALTRSLATASAPSSTRFCPRMRAGRLESPSFRGSSGPSKVSGRRAASPRRLASRGRLCSLCSSSLLGGRARSRSGLYWSWQAWARQRRPSALRGAVAGAPAACRTCWMRSVRSAALRATPRRCLPGSPPLPSRGLPLQPRLLRRWESLRRSPRRSSSCRRWRWPASFRSPRPTSARQAQRSHSRCVAKASCLRAPSPGDSSSRQSKPLLGSAWD